MNRRRFAGLVVAALAATSTISATPAHAQTGLGDPVSCLPDTSGPGTPPQGVVTVNGLDVTVNPNGGVDANGVVGFAIDAAIGVYVYPFCVAGVYDDPVWCMYYEALGSGYVYMDPNTGAVTVRGNELAADVNTCT